METRVYLKTKQHNIFASCLLLLLLLYSYHKILSFNWLSWQNNTRTQWNQHGLNETENFSKAHWKHIRSHKMCVCVCVHEVPIITVYMHTRDMLTCAWYQKKRRKWKRLFYIYCLISWQQKQSNDCFVWVCVSHVRVHVGALCLCECLILKVKWFYAILIICVNEYEYLLDNCIAYAIELSHMTSKTFKIDFRWV